MKGLRRVQDDASHHHFSLPQGACELDTGIVAYHQSATRLQAWWCCPTFFKEKNCAYCVLLTSLIRQPAGVDRSLVPTQIADPYNATRPVDLRGELWRSRTQGFHPPTRRITTSRGG